MEVEGDAPGAPNGTALSGGTATFALTSGATNNLATTLTMYAFNLASGVSLSANTIYWIVLTPSAATSTAYIFWGANNNNQYTLGEAMYSTGANSFANTALGTSRDMVFSLGCSTSAN